MATLKSPMTTQTLDTVKVVAWKVEENPSKANFWIEIWSVIGYMDGSDFVEYINPNTGEAAIYRKIENGRNPLDNSQLLGRCSHPPCQKWFPGQVAGTCDLCGHDIEPYDGYDRLYDGKKVKSKDLEDFMCDEEVPDPNDPGALVYLLDATKDA